MYPDDHNDQAATTAPELATGPDDGAPIISVVIPCYNQAHYLGEAIESVLRQGVADVEIIVVDDGSHDDTRAVAGRYPQVSYLRQPNQGLSAARNSGLRASRGRYLVFLDADDYLLPNALAAGLACLERHPGAGFVFGHHHYVRGDGSLLSEYPPEIVAEGHYRALLRGNFIGMHATVMFRRAAFDAVGGYNTALRSCEDYDLYLRMARRFPIAQHTALVAAYRWHNANMTNNSARMLRSARAVLCAQWPFIHAQPADIAACRQGLRFWRGYFGGRALGLLRSSPGPLAARARAQLPGLARFCSQWLLTLAAETAMALPPARPLLGRLLRPQPRRRTHRPAARHQPN